jgi:hypothetical protein
MNATPIRHLLMAEKPMHFFTGEIKKLAPGKLLLPAEGEGRNAVF